VTEFSPLTGEIEAARRVCFMVETAAHTLGINMPSSATTDEWLDAILQGAMESPTAVTPGEFDLVYRLRGC
jgi:hypothetical protein